MKDEDFDKLKTEFAYDVQHVIDALVGFADKWEHRGSDIEQLTPAQNDELGRIGDAIDTACDRLR